MKIITKEHFFRLINMFNKMKQNVVYIENPYYYKLIYKNVKYIAFKKEA